MAAVLVTYANSLTNGFSLDDVHIVEQNARVHQLVDQAAIWLTPYWPTFGEHLGLYRPLTIFGYAVQWAVGGGAPWVFHAINVLLHLMVSTLVFGLLRRLTSEVPALLGALLFAVHPVHTEVVAGVVGQAELIAAAAVLAACIVWIDRPTCAPSRRRTLLLTAIFAIGLLAKEGAIVLPGLLIALDFATGRAGPQRRALIRYGRAVAGSMLVILAGLAAYMTLRIAVLGSIGGVDAAPNLPFLRQGHRFLSALRAWPEYARLLVFPMDLSADYSPGVVLPVEYLSPMVILGAGLLAGTVSLATLTPWFRRAGLPAAWFFVAVFPVSNLVMPIGVLLAERILYLPSVAVSIAIAFACDRVRHAYDARTIRRLGLAAAAVLLTFSVRSILRNPSWKNTESVWDTLGREHPESYRAQWTNASRAFARGNRKLATGFFELATRLWDGDAIVLNNLAGMYVQEGRFEEALPLLAKSDSLVGEILESTPQIRAYAYLGLHRYADALAATIQSDRLGSDRPLVMAMRAQAYEGLGRYSTAAGTWRFATRFPRSRTAPTFWMMLARDLARAGFHEQALAAVDTAAHLIESGSPIDRSLQRLRQAIDSRCYASGASAHSPHPDESVPCDDPLAAWGIILPPSGKEVANPLQNARS